MAVEITCTVRGPSPRRPALRQRLLRGESGLRPREGGPTLAVPFGKIAEKILGKNYSLSLVLSGDKLTRKINRTYRKKDYPANVLSFALSKDEGEIFLNVRKAEREAKTLGI